MRPANQSPASPLSSGLPEGQHLPLAVLRQYVAGTLPAAEQHRVEAHTLSCGRCADVLEGLSRTDLATTDRAVHDLQARLRARVASETVDTTPVVPLWPMRQLVAAVLLLLVGAGLWLGVRRSTEGPAASSQIAMRAPAPRLEAEKVVPAAPAEAPETSQADDAATVASTSAAPEVGRQQRRPPAVAVQRGGSRRVVPGAAAYEPVVPAEAAEAAMDKAPVAVLAPVGAGADAQSASRPEVPSQYPASAEQEKLEVAMARPAKKKAGAPSAAGDVAANARKMAPLAADKSLLNAQVLATMAAPAGTRVVRGRVTDQQNGAGLPGVTVLAKGTRMGVSTAADGSFMLMVPDSVRALTFHFIGYSSLEQPLRPSDSTLALALAPDARQLSEVVVVRRERPPAPVAVGALPAGGYPAFREYLKKALQYPEKALKDGKEGTVKLRFVVAVDGSLQDVKVVRSLTEECDAEAIRLLKEGPKWYPAIGKGRRVARTVEISVPFRVTE